jgi:hypothetical protein
MKILNNENNKDLVRRIDYLDQKLDLIHRSLARLRIDLPCLIQENRDIQKKERVR